MLFTGIFQQGFDSFFQNTLFIGFCVKKCLFLSKHINSFKFCFQFPINHLPIFQQEDSLSTTKGISLPGPTIVVGGDFTNIARPFADRKVSLKSISP